MTDVIYRRHTIKRGEKQYHLVVPVETFEAVKYFSKKWDTTMIDATKILIDEAVKRHIEEVK